MQQDNNIENKLRQLDDEQQPDLGNMDAHWQQMQAMLQPVALPVKMGLPKWMLNALSVIAVVILIGGAMIYLSPSKKARDTNIDERPALVKDPVNTSMALLQVTAGDSGLVQPAIQSTIPAIESGRSPQQQYKEWQEEDSLLANLKLNIIPCTSCPLPAKDSSPALNVNRQLQLNHLLSSLKKEEQDFVIDNARDTLIIAKEGTVLRIPANSLGGYVETKLTVKEFYKRSDIILNQLSTVSNKDQLVTGGMLYIAATYKGAALGMNQQAPIVWYMPDTSSNMQGMQLFDGKEKQGSQQAGQLLGSSMPKEITGGEAAAPGIVNWVPQGGQYFTRKQLVTQVWVLNVVDQPFRVKEKRKGQVGYFIIEEDSIKMDKEKLKQELKNRYGYYKVRLRSGIRNWFKYSNDDKEFNREYAANIGDSIWIDQATADKYKLVGTATRQVEVKNIVTVGINAPIPVDALLNRSTIRASVMDTTAEVSKQLEQRSLILQNLQNRYSVNLNQLGWINCDRFYSDSRQKIQYTVDLGDAAVNYHTLLVFDKLNSIMDGAYNGNKVMFQNIPLGEAVSVVSIGISKNGETVYSVTHTTTSNQELKVLQFESIAAPGLKAALSNIDK